MQDGVGGGGIVALLNVDLVHIIVYYLDLVDSFVFEFVFAVFDLLITF